MGKIFRKWKDSRQSWDRKKRTFRKYRQMIHRVKSNTKKMKKKLYAKEEMKGYTGNLRNFREENNNG